MKRLMLLILFVFPFLQVAAQDTSCPSSTALPLEIGGWAHVREGITVRLRETPSTSANILTEMRGGERFIVMDESRCAEGLRWWLVSSYYGLQGWAAEGQGENYFLVKTERRQAPAAPPEENADLPEIDTANQIETWGYGLPTATSWSADGATLAVATTAGILLYNADDPDTEPTFLAAQADAYSDIAFNPVINHQLLATDDSGGVWLWNIESVESTLFAALEGAASGAKFNADGSVIFARTDEWIYVWDAETGERTHALFSDYAGEPQSESQHAISADGTTIVTTEYGYPVQVWDISGAEAVVTELSPLVPNSWFKPLAFSADNTQLYGGTLEGMYGWSWQTGEATIFEWGDMDRTPNFDGGFMLEDGRLLTFDFPYDVKLWNDDPQPIDTLELNGLQSWYGMSVSPDARHAAGLASYGGLWVTLVIIDLETLDLVYESDPFTEITFMTASNVSLAYNGQPGVMTLRDLDTAEIVDTVPYSGGDIIAMAMSDDGQQFVLCPGPGSPGGYIFYPTLYGFNLNDSKEGELLYSVSSDELSQFNVSCGWVVYDGDDFLTDTFSPYGGYAAYGERQVFVFPDGMSSHLHGAEVDGSALWVSGQNIGVYRVDLATGELEQKFEPSVENEENSGNYFRSLSDLADNRLAVVGNSGGRSVLIYDTETEETLFSLDSESPITALTFSPDGSTLVTGHDDGSIRQWDAATGEVLGQVGRAARSITSLVFNSDATRLYSAGSDGVGRVWNMERE